MMKGLLLFHCVLVFNLTDSTPYITTKNSFLRPSTHTPSYISSTEASLATTRDYQVTDKQYSEHVCAEGCECQYHKQNVFKALCDVYLMEDSNSQNLSLTNSFNLLYSYGPSLKILQIENCDGEFDIFNWASWPNLEKLDIRNCSLNSSIFDQFEGLQNLQEFSFTESNLESLEVDWSLLKKMTKLDVSKNKFKSTQFLSTCTENLIHLKLSENSFQEFDIDKISSMAYLETLDLSKNEYLDRVISTSTSRKMNHLLKVNISSSPQLSKICNSVMYSVPNLEVLDVSFSSLLHVPSYLPRLKKLEKFLLEGTTPLCDCQLPRFMSSLLAPQAHHNLQCKIPLKAEPGFLSVGITSSTISSLLGCEEVQLDHSLENTTDAVLVHTTELLQCNTEGAKANVLWVTPRKLLLRQFMEYGDAETCKNVNDRIHLKDTDTAYDREYSHIHLLSNGSLLINDFGWIDRGIYQCFVDNGVSSDSIVVTKTLDFAYKNTIYYRSLVCGFSSAAGFLALTLLLKLVHYILWNYGCCICCGCCQDRIAPKTKKLRKVVDSIESYRSQQLEKLTDSYSMQSEKIRENCAVQMEKVRDNYSKQAKTAKDMRTYGSAQCTLVRDQYFDQISRIRDYSMLQLEKCHENYIFQRQRLRKFSAQNYLKIRETRKYTQKTLNKVLDNMPALYHDLTSCKQGVGDPRVESMYFDGELDLKEIELLELDAGPRLRGLRDVSVCDADSVYFTPSGTPMRDPSSPKSPSTDPYEELYRTDPIDEVDAGPSTSKDTGKGHRRMVSNLSNFLPFWWGMGAGSAAIGDQEPPNEGTTTVIIENTQCKDGQEDCEAKVNESMLDDSDCESGETIAKGNRDTDSQETITNTTSLLQSTDSSRITIV